jgi:hypothetical protein
MSIQLDADHPAIRAALAQAQASPVTKPDSKRGRSKQPLTNDSQTRRSQYSASAGKRRGSGPEQAIQNSILEYLHRRGILAWRINSGAVKAAHGGLITLAPAGHPDIAGIYNKKPLYIEVKKPGGKVTKLQQTFIDTLLEAGALAFVATSIDDVRYHLEREP